MGTKCVAAIVNIFFHDSTVYLNLYDYARETVGRMILL